MWATEVTVGGQRHDRLRNAHGSVVVQTALQGTRYRVFSTSDPSDVSVFCLVNAVE
jgi:hypothetical protein